MKRFSRMALILCVFCGFVLVAARPALGGSSFTDSRDGKTYRTVVIGEKTWMAENLNFQTGNSWCYDNNNAHCNTYGRLYDWNTARNACPAGWRLSTRQDWTDLVNAVGGRSNAGTALKSSPSDSPSWNGANTHGFFGFARRLPLGRW